MIPCVCCGIRPADATLGPGGKRAWCRQCWRDKGLPELLYAWEPEDAPCATDVRENERRRLRGGLDNGR